MNKLAKYIVIVFTVIIIALLAILIFVPAKKSAPVKNVAAIQGTKASSDGSISIVSPNENALIDSPIVVSGIAKGNWFFEAVFPVKVLDGDGMVLGQGQARAEGDWTTTGTVPFSATISFSLSRFTTGTIVFSKDNPSGLPQNAESFSVPIQFK
jgi:hypothetical protein